MIPAPLHRIDSRLIDHIGQIRAYSTAGCQRYRIQIHTVIHEHVLRMHFQNLHAAFQIRFIHDNSSVKTPRTQQCLIQNLRPVSSTQNQNTLGRIKTVHLRQQLVQRLFPFLVSSAVFGITAAPNGINFIDEYNTRGIFSGFFEQIPHPGSAYPHI